MAFEDEYLNIILDLQSLLWLKVYIAKVEFPILKQICFDCGLVYHLWRSVPVKTDVEAVCPESELRSLCSHVPRTWTLGSLGT